MKKKYIIEKTEREGSWAELEQFDPISKKNSFIEIIKWTNGEGVDVNISNYSEKQISLTWGELKAITKLSNKLLK